MDLDPTEACEVGVTFADTAPAGDIDCEQCAGVRAVDLAAGAEHACVLLSSGHVRCWGAGKGIGAAEPYTDLRDENGVDPLDATGGPVDLSKDVVDDGNGRIFAGGATTCLTAAEAAKSWCWGVGFQPEPVPLAHKYSALIPSDRHDILLNQVQPTWFVCGFTKKSENYDMRCWGLLEPESFDIFEPTDADCVADAADAEATVKPRTMTLTAPVRGDAGRAGLCAAADGKTHCAGYTDALSICGTAKCTSASCPGSCNTTECTAPAKDVAVADLHFCLLTDDGVQCIENEMPVETFTFDDLCGPLDGDEPFVGSTLAMTAELVCAGDTTTHRVCCRRFDGEAGALAHEGPLVKLAARADDILLLESTGQVWRIDATLTAALEPLQP